MQAAIVMQQEHVPDGISKEVQPQQDVSGDTDKRANARYRALHMNMSYSI